MERVEFADRPMEVARSQVRYGTNVPLFRAHEVFRKVVFHDLNSLFDQLDYAALDRASQVLADARNVLVVNTMADYCASTLLYRTASTWFRNWRETGLYNAARGQFVEDVGDGGVLVAIATPPYKYELLCAALEARDCGARVIGITDCPESPLSIATQDLLVAPMPCRGAFKSHACIAALVEMLVVMAAARSVTPVACDAGQTTD